MGNTTKPHRKGGKKNRKHGRNKIKCERYRREWRRDKNKDRRATKIQKSLARAADKRLNKQATGGHNEDRGRGPEQGEGSASADPSCLMWYYVRPSPEREWATG